VSELARRHGITASQIHSWKAGFLAAQAALRGAEGKSENKQLEMQVEKLELSRSEFAQLPGVSERTLEGWEQKRRTPTGVAGGRTSTQGVARGFT
jgi:transposase-like protein